VFSVYWKVPEEITLGRSMLIVLQYIFTITTHDWCPLQRYIHYSLNVRGTLAFPTRKSEKCFLRELGEEEDGENYIMKSFITCTLLQA
jgi:hypothetical protein